MPTRRDQVGARRGGRALASRLSQRPPAVVVRGVIDWPGLPSLADHTQALAKHLRAAFVRDDGVFTRYPPAAGSAPPRSFIAVFQAKAKQ